MPAEVLTLGYEEVPEGLWRVESLGTPFEVNIVGDWWVQPNDPGEVVLTDPDSRGPGDLDVVFIRPTALSHPSDPNDASQQWPVDDIDGWLEAMAGDVVAGPTEAQVGGAEGIVFEVELASGPGIVFVKNADVSGKEFNGGDRYIVYWLDQGEHAPIAIIVGAAAAAIDDWSGVAESLLDRVSFGEPAPHPSA